MSTIFELPTYVQNEDQENYNEELNQTLRQLLSSDGRPQANLTTAEIALVSTTADIGTVWFNTDLAKLQVKTANPAVVETVTSV